MNEIRLRHFDFGSNLIRMSNTKYTEEKKSQNIPEKSPHILGSDQKFSKTQKRAAKCLKCVDIRYRILKKTKSHYGDSIRSCHSVIQDFDTPK